MLEDKGVEEVEGCGPFIAGSRPHLGFLHHSPTSSGGVDILGLWPPPPPRVPPQGVARPLRDASRGGVSLLKGARGRGAGPQDLTRVTGRASLFCPQHQLH